MTGQCPKCGSVPQAEDACCAQCGMRRPAAGWPSAAGLPAAQPAPPPAGTPHDTALKEWLALPQQVAGLDRQLDIRFNSEFELRPNTDTMIDYFIHNPGPHLVGVRIAIASDELIAAAARQRSVKRFGVSERDHDLELGNVGWFGVHVHPLDTFQRTALKLHAIATRTRAGRVPAQIEVLRNLEQVPVNAAHGGAAPLNVQINSVRYGDLSIQKLIAFEEVKLAPGDAAAAAHLEDQAKSRLGNKVGHLPSTRPLAILGRPQGASLPLLWVFEQEHARPRYADFLARTFICWGDLLRLGRNHDKLDAPTGMKRRGAHGASAVALRKFGADGVPNAPGNAARTGFIHRTLGWLFLDPEKGPQLQADPQANGFRRIGARGKSEAVAVQPTPLFETRCEPQCFTLALDAAEFALEISPLREQKSGPPVKPFVSALLHEWPCPRPVAAGAMIRRLHDGEIDSYCLAGPLLRIGNHEDDAIQVEPGLVANGPPATFCKLVMVDVPLPSADSDDAPEDAAPTERRVFLQFLEGATAVRPFAAGIALDPKVLLELHEKLVIEWRDLKGRKRAVLRPASPAETKEPAAKWA